MAGSTNGSTGMKRVALMIRTWPGISQQFESMRVTHQRTEGRRLTKSDFLWVLLQEWRRTHPDKPPVGLNAFR